MFPDYYLSVSYDYAVTKHVTLGEAFALALGEMLSATSWLLILLLLS